MKTTAVMTALSAAALALVACGSNEKPIDAAKAIDAAVDGPGSIPPPPALGAEIDRLGRPGINTFLNHAFDGSATTAGAAKDAYNQDASGPASWGSNTTYLGAFVTTLGIFDTLDQGLGTAGGAGSACGNQILYDKSTTAGAHNPCLTGGNFAGSSCSYAAAGLFAADDELYVETSQSTCSQYLAVEVDTVLATAIADCGGRAPSYDVIDVSYSALAAFPAAGGFNGVAPMIGDGVSKHTDTSDATFPFLGSAHPAPTM
jgi:hypothetical protein